MAVRESVIKLQRTNVRNACVRIVIKRKAVKILVLGSTGSKATVGVPAVAFLLFMHFVRVSGGVLLY